MENIPQNISQTLDVLAQKFGATGEHLWKVIIEQQIIDAQIFLIFGILLGTIAIITIIISFSETDDTDSCGSLFLIGMIILFLACFLLAQSYGHFRNPEFRALEQVIGMLGRVR